MENKAKQLPEKEKVTLISLRIPDILLNKIKERASKENRNFSNMVVTSLKEIYEKN